MHFSEYILVFSCVSSLYLGLVVYLAREKRNVRLSFLMYTLSVVLWSIVTWLSVESLLFADITLARTSIALGAIQLTFLALAISGLTQPRAIVWRTRVLTIGLLVTALCMTPWVFVSAALTADGVETEVAPGMLLFVAHTIVMLLSIFKMLLPKRNANSVNSEAIKRNLLWGISLTYGLTLVANFSLVLLGVESLMFLGPLFPLIFSGFFVHAIFNYDAFLVTNSAARNGAYAIFLVAILLPPIWLVVDLFQQRLTPQSSVEVIILNGVLLLAAVAAAPNIKKIIDSATDKMFGQKTKSYAASQSELDAKISKATEKFAKEISSLKQENDQHQRAIRTAAHQLRSPLSIINLVVGESGQKEDDEESKILDSEVARMTDIIDTFLHSQIQNAQKSEPEDGEFSIRQLVSSVESSAQKLLRSKEQQLVVNAPNKTAIVKGSRTGMQEAIWILLDNAHKYSPQKTTINLEIQKIGKYMQVLVKDQGRGLGPLDLDIVTQEFQRGANRNVVGYGLGLSIVKNHVQSAGGEMLYEASENGAAFGFKIPIGGE